MKLSVFVVTYNQEQYVRQALDSILCQKTAYDYEIVVADDCSQDSTPAILDEYAAKYPHIKVYHNSVNLGFVKNWKFALSKCTGEYVSILEGDDYWLTDYRLQKQVELLDAHPEYGMCCAKAKIWNETQQRFDGIGGNDKCEQYEALLIDRNDVLTSTTMIRRTLFEQAYIDLDAFLPEYLQWDTSIWFWFARNSQIKFMDDFYEVWRVLEKSGSHEVDVYKSLDKELIRPKTIVYFINRYPINDYNHAKMIIDNLMADIRFVGYATGRKKEAEVWNTKTYQLGAKIKKIFH